MTRLLIPNKPTHDLPLCVVFWIISEEGIPAPYLKSAPGRIRLKTSNQRSPEEAGSREVNTVQVGRHYLENEKRRIEQSGVIEYIAG